MYQIPGNTPAFNIAACAAVLFFGLTLAQEVSAKDSNEQKAIDYCTNAGFDAKKCSDCGRKNSKNCECCYKKKPFWCPKGLAKAPVTHGMYKNCITGKKLGAVARDISKLGNAVKVINPQSITKAYDAYFAYIASGRKGRKKSIPKDIIAQYQPYFRADLSKVKMAETKKLKGGMGGTAMTNCKTIWWPEGSGMADNPGKSAYWFAHELQHYEQCMNKGGRRNYAAMWFGQVGGTYIRLILNNEKGDVKEGGLHDAMPMEKDATDKGRTVESAIKKSLASSSTASR